MDSILSYESSRSSPATSAMNNASGSIEVYSKVVDGEFEGVSY
jgi:hypothetical protein